MHELPPHARLRVVESPGGDLDAVRARIVAVKDEIGRIERIAVLSDDLGERMGVKVKRFVVEEIDFLRDTARLTVYFDYPVRMNKRP